MANSETYIDDILVVTKKMLELSECGFKDDEENTTLKMLIERISSDACLLTGYRTLPKRFYSIVSDVIVEYFVRLGHEGIASRSELGVSTIYVYDDIYSSLKSKLRGLKNPRIYLGLWSD